MFFARRRRKRYNGLIDTLLNERYHIDTKSDPDFPGVMAYLELIDNGWGSKWSPEETSYYIATLLYCGLFDQGNTGKAEAVYNAMSPVVAEGIDTGCIRIDISRRFMQPIQERRDASGGFGR